MYPSNRANWRRALTLAVIGPLAMLSVAAHAVKTSGGEFNTLYAGLGIKGYDPVAYFTDGAPALGNEAYTYEYGGVTWRFASQAHRDLFAENPSKYAPQYGGFCSWGVGEANRLFDVDPVNGWSIYDGKLYLNFNADINKSFNKNPSALITKANHNWPALNQ